VRKAALWEKAAAAVALVVVAVGATWLATGTGSANPGTSISVSMDSNSVDAGASFDVSVVVDTDVPIRGVQFALDFDPSLAEVDSVDEGPFLKDWAESAGNQTLKFPDPQIDNNAGHVTDIGIAVVGTNEGGASGQGVLATYHMKAKEGAKGVSPLKLSNVIVSDAQAVSLNGVAQVDGEVGVGGAEAKPMNSQSGASAPSGGPAGGEAKRTANVGSTPFSNVRGATKSKSSDSSDGLSLPWEIVGGVVGAVVVVGGVTFAVRRRRTA
jgi:hypothetical protein